VHLHIDPPEHSALASSPERQYLTRPGNKFSASGGSFRGPGGSLLGHALFGVPVLAYYPVGRTALDRTPGSTTPSSWAPERAWEDAFSATANYDAFFRWFREREDLENEARVQDGASTDPRLDAVRRAVESVIPGFHKLRIRRPRDTPDEHHALRRPTLTVEKAGQVFGFGQLSEGERNLIALVADIARRMSIARPGLDASLSSDGVVLIDEVDLHLHPKWQVDVLPRLLEIFPNLQFIVTTHSPLVLTGVASDRIRMFENFAVVQPAHPVEGRDAGAILAEVFGTEPLPQSTRAAIHSISQLIDEDRLDEARSELDALEMRLGGLDADVTRLRTSLALMTG